MIRFWTEQDDADLKRLYDACEPDWKIGEYLERTCDAVVARRRRLELYDSNIARAAKLKFGNAPRRSLAEILDDVSSLTGVHRRDIRSKCRTRYIAHARQAFMAHAYATGRYSLPKIGCFLGMHHTSVMHGIIRHAERSACQLSDCA